ncbi:hypothetical protein F5Y16DRAFT_421857 [Xylariaceae sp. FL0255]|nr:hypothetical protein F5Y16DRAFT_421857 [Xylariaceae sp. FL0255]
MALTLAPYTNAMRLDMGFNSYTQQLCVNDAVVKSNSAKAQEQDLKARRLREKKAGEGENAGGDETDGETQPSKGSERSTSVKRQVGGVSSLEIKYSSVGGKGAGAFLDSNKFKDSDLAFHLQVKVVNQILEAEDVTEFNPIKDLDPSQFTDVFGDSFISGFIAGGEFNAVVCYKVKDKSKLRVIKASAEINFDKVPGLSVNAQGNAEFKESDISATSETNVSVAWSGGKPTPEELMIRKPIEAGEKLEEEHLKEITALQQRVTDEEAAKKKAIEEKVEELRTAKAEADDLRPDAEETRRLRREAGLGGERKRKEEEETLKKNTAKEVKKLIDNANEDAQKFKQRLAQLERDVSTKAEEARAAEADLEAARAEVALLQVSEIARGELSKARDELSAKNKQMESLRAKLKKANEEVRISETALKDFREAAKMIGRLPLKVCQFGSLRLPPLLLQEVAGFERWSQNWRLGYIGGNLNLSADLVEAKVFNYSQSVNGKQAVWNRYRFIPTSVKVSCNFHTITGVKVNYANDEVIEVNNSGYGGGASIGLSEGERITSYEVGGSHSAEYGMSVVTYLKLITNKSRSLTIEPSKRLTQDENMWRESAPEGLSFRGFWGQAGAVAIVRLGLVWALSASFSLSTAYAFSAGIPHNEISCATDRNSIETCPKQISYCVTVAAETYSDRLRVLDAREGNPFSVPCAFDLQSLERTWLQYVDNDGLRGSSHEVSSTSSSEHVEHLSISGGISLDCAVVSASAAGSYDKTVLENRGVNPCSNIVTHASKHSAKATIRLGTISMMSSPLLCRDAEKMLSCAPALKTVAERRFFQQFGDYYVAGIRLGGDSSAFVSVDAESLFQSESLTVKVEVRVLFWSASWESTTTDESLAESMQFRFAAFDSLTQKCDIREDSVSFREVKDLVDRYTEFRNSLVDRTIRLRDSLGLRDGMDVEMADVNAICNSGLVVEIILQTYVFQRDYVIKLQGKKVYDY